MNLNANDSDFLILPELRGVSVTSDPTNRLYFSTPTPGGPKWPRHHQSRPADRGHETHSQPTGGQ